MIKLNDTIITPTLFPDNTSQIWKLPKRLFDTDEYVITWEFSHEGELIQVAQLSHLLKVLHPEKKRTLNIPFLPYGRQDKPVSNNTTFALYTFGSIINSMKFDTVTTIDAHSNIAGGAIANLKDLGPIRTILSVIKETKPTAIAFPDKGARDRYITKLGNMDLIVGYKTRDQSTGYITNYEFEGNAKNHSVLIVDDIVDGGITFKILTKDLLKAGAKDVNLYATHGIFSKGAKALFDSGISRIFTHKGEIFPHPENNFTIKRFK